MNSSRLKTTSIATDIFESSKEWANARSEETVG